MKLELPGFDTLRYLAENDPALLERLRHTLTEQLIARSPEESQRRLRGLQFQINAKVKLAPNPIAACIAVSSMMHDALDHLQRAFFDTPEPEPVRQRHAVVLSFPSATDPR